MTILAGKLTEETGELVVVLLSNPANAAVTLTEKVNTGEYVATIDKPILNSDMPAKWYVANSSGNIYSVSAINQTQFSVQCYNPPATPVDGSLSNAEFQIETY